MRPIGTPLERKRAYAGMFVVLAIVIIIAFGYDALRYRQLASMDFQGTTTLPEVQPSGEVLLRTRCTSNDFLTIRVTWTEEGNARQDTHRLLMTGKISQSSYQYTAMTNPTDVVVQVFNDDPKLTTDTCHVEFVKKRW